MGWVLTIISPTLHSSRGAKICFSSSGGFAGSFKGGASRMFRECFVNSLDVADDGAFGVDGAWRRSGRLVC